MDKLNQILETLTKESKPLVEAEKTIKVNESVGQAAFYYEKLRNSLDWQDEHLFLKNAIKRTLRRRIYLGMNQRDTAKVLLRDLVWAKYFLNESVPLGYIEEVAAILRKYNYLRSNVVSRANSRKVTEVILGLAACEIEEFLRPSNAEKDFVELTVAHIKGNLQISEHELPSEEIETMLRVGVSREIFKADLDQLRFYLLRKQYPNWPRVSKSDVGHMGKNYDIIITQVDRHIYDNDSRKLQRASKRYIPPFRIVWEILSRRYDSGIIIKNEDALESASIEIIRKRNKNIYSRVLRSVTRGIIFILLTKIVLALIIEYPYELRYLGEINYTALYTNILLPPALMLVIGLFIKTPGMKNTRMLVNQVRQIVIEDKFDQPKTFTLKKKRSKLYFLFDGLYFISSIGILILVIWGLISLRFNVVSIGLFFFFVSLVSFLAFRISSIAKELEVRRRDDTALIGIYNFIFLPFVFIGKILSEQWSNYNLTLWFWDFIVEAPFKTIMSLFESWLSFVREKREDFE